MGWSEVAARSHARRLERERWIERHPMTRGEGSLLVASRVGVAMSRVPVRASGRPAPTWWAHHCASAWAAAWLTVRGRGVVGPREVLESRVWSGKISWQDHHGYHRQGHRPDLICKLDDTYVIPVEVELTQKSAERLRAILELHAGWLVGGKSSAVFYVCDSEKDADRIRKAANRQGLSEERGTLRIELVDTIKAEAEAACEDRRASRTSAA
jgi:hypothetical protein